LISTSLLDQIRGLHYSPLPSFYFLVQVQSHQLGALLRSIYLDNSSPSFIDGIRTDLVDNSEVKVRVKAGGEGTVVFDSAIALLQGLFPPNPNNKIVLANETTIVAPLGGYQYVPGEYYTFPFESCQIT
jgi:lysosomal acid phosphatase